VSNVAFKTPAGKIVLIVSNDSRSAKQFNVRHREKQFAARLEGGSVVTYIWNK
jgi:glucosylceramidase